MRTPSLAICCMHHPDGARFDTLQVVTMFPVDKMDTRHNVLFRLAKVCNWRNTPMDTFCNSLSSAYQNTNRSNMGYNLLLDSCTYL